MAQVIMEDLDHIKKTYGRKRRTVIENREEAVFEEKKVEEAEVCFLMDRFGYAKVLDKNTYERNKETVHGEYKYVFTCMNTDKICLFTNKGQMHTVKVMDLPLTRLRDKGVPIDNLSNFSSAQEELLCVSNMEAVKNASLIFVTKSGMIKQAVRKRNRSCPDGAYDAVCTENAEGSRWGRAGMLRSIHRL